MKRIAFVFGSLAGGITVVYSFIVFAVFGDIASITPSELQIVEWLGYLRYIILLLAVFMAMRAFARRHTDRADYWQVVRTGVLATVVVAGFVGLMEFAYALLNPNFYEEFARLSIEQMQQSGASEEAIRKVSEHAASFRWMSNPFAAGAFYFIETTLLGVVGALLFGLVFRTRRTPSVAVS